LLPSSWMPSKGRAGIETERADIGSDLDFQEPGGPYALTRPVPNLPPRVLAKLKDAHLRSIRRLAG
jgi:hypothetical protein